MSICRKPYPSDASAEAWSLVAPCLLLHREDAGQREHDLRAVFDGLRYIVKTGAPWRWMPNDLPPRAAAYQQTQRWLAAGCFEALVDDLRAVLRLAAGRGSSIRWTGRRNGDPFDASELEGQRCYGGLDLSSTRDLTALALWFPDAGKLLVWHFVPEDTMRERSERDRVPYDQWAAEGWIETTPGRATDRLAIALRLADIRSMYDVQGIAFDRWRFEDLQKLLNDEGIELPLSEFVPGFRSYAAAIDTFERAVLDKRMQHNNSPILKWQAGNVVVKPDPAGNRKPMKDKSFDRIDGIVAAIMACSLAGKDDWQEVYRGEGVMWL